MRQCVRAYIWIPTLVGASLLVPCAVVVSQEGPGTGARGARGRLGASRHGDLAYLGRVVAHRILHHWKINAWLLVI